MFPPYCHLLRSRCCDSGFARRRAKPGSGGGRSRIATARSSGYSARWPQGSRGGVAERSNAAVSKTVSGGFVRRGFKSLPLRLSSFAVGSGMPPEPGLARREPKFQLRQRYGRRGLTGETRFPPCWNAAVSKTVSGGFVRRGFKSLPLRLLFPRRYAFRRARRRSPGPCSQPRSRGTCR
jgi:hypothetical protein